jgi:hypothetical protein
LHLSPQDVGRELEGFAAMAKPNTRTPARAIVANIPDSSLTDVKSGASLQQTSEDRRTAVLGCEDQNSRLVFADAAVFSVSEDGCVQTDPLKPWTPWSVRPWSPWRD